MWEETLKRWNIELSEEKTRPNRQQPLISASVSAHRICLHWFHLLTVKPNAGWFVHNNRTIQKEVQLYMMLFDQSWERLSVTQRANERKAIMELMMSLKKTRLNSCFQDSIHRLSRWLNAAITIISLQSDSQSAGRREIESINIKLTCLLHIDVCAAQNGVSVCVLPVHATAMTPKCLIFELHPKWNRRV